MRSLTAVISGLRADARSVLLLVFFFHDTATPEIYTLSLHDALPILQRAGLQSQRLRRRRRPGLLAPPQRERGTPARSEEHTSELQSRLHLVCRLLLEKKKKKKRTHANTHKQDTKDDRKNYASPSLRT